VLLDEDEVVFVVSRLVPTDHCYVKIGAAPEKAVWIGFKSGAELCLGDMDFNETKRTIQLARDFK
jgi:hypothetical protein